MQGSTNARPMRQYDDLTDDALQPCALYYSTDHRDERRAAPRPLDIIVHAYGLSGGDY